MELLCINSSQSLWEIISKAFPYDFISEAVADAKTDERQWVTEPLEKWEESRRFAVMRDVDYHRKVHQLPAIIELTSQGVCHNIESMINTVMQKNIDWEHAHNGIPKETPHIHDLKNEIRGDGRSLTPAEQEKFQDKINKGMKGK